MVEDDLERQAQVRAGADREADSLQRRQPVEALDRVRVELGVVEREPRPVGDRLHPEHVLVGQGIRPAPFEQAERADDRAACVHGHDQDAKRRRLAGKGVEPDVLPDLVVQHALQGFERDRREQDWLAGLDHARGQRRGGHRT